MKTLITLFFVAISLIGVGQTTVGDKSTEVGYNLGQTLLDSNSNSVIVHLKAGSFYCYKIEKSIPPTAEQGGSLLYFWNTVDCGADTTLPQAVQDSCNAYDINTPKANIEATFKAWLAEQEWKSRPIPDSTYVKQ